MPRNGLEMRMDKTKVANISIQIHVPNDLDQNFYRKAQEPIPVPSACAEVSEPHTMNGFLIAEGVYGKGDSHGQLEV